MRGICSKLILKLLERHNWRFIIPFVEFVNFEQISLMVTEPP